MEKSDDNTGTGKRIQDGAVGGKNPRAKGQRTKYTAVVRSEWYQPAAIFLLAAENTFGCKRASPGDTARRHATQLIRDEHGNLNAEIVKEPPHFFYFFSYFILCHNRQVGRCKPDKVNLSVFPYPHIILFHYEIQ